MLRRFLTSSLVTVALVASVLTGCSDDDSGVRDRPDVTEAAPTPASPEGATTTSVPVPPPLPVEWEPCGSVECGSLTVPLDYSDPDGASIHLALARLPAGNPEARIGSLLFNPGGPGASGVDLVRSGTIPFDDELVDRFDIVSWDPRGVGASAPLSCGSQDDEYLETDATPDDEAEEEALRSVAEAVAVECSETDPEILSDLGTTRVVEDLDRIRQALGEARLTYVGYSYGTLIGELYAEHHPDRIRAMVLDGVVDPSLDLAGTARGQAAGLERTLEKIFAECPGSSGCRLDDAAAAFDRVAEDLEGGAGEATGTSPSELQLATVRATYDRRFWPELYGAVADADDGDYAGIEDLAQSYRDIGPYSPYVAILCSDLPAPDGYTGFAQLAGELTETAPRLGGAVGFELLPCAYWPVEATRDPGPVTAAGAPPILVVGNTGDAATPYEQAETVAETLESGVLLTLDGEGHLSYGDPCIDGWVETYLIDLEVPAEGTVC